MVPSGEYLPKTKSQNLMVQNLWLKIIYKFLNVCPFDYMAVAVSGKVGRP